MIIEAEFTIIPPNIMVNYIQVYINIAKMNEVLKSLENVGYTVIYDKSRNIAMVPEIMVIIQFVQSKIVGGDGDEGINIQSM